MDKFDEYKFFAENTEKLSERRQAAIQTYLGVNAAILIVMGLLVKEVGMRGWMLTLVSLPLFLFGIVAYLTWYRMISMYKDLLGWRYEQLRKMEETDLPDSYRLFSKEWEYFYLPRTEKGKAVSFSGLEAWLPKSLVGLYAFFFLIEIAATLLGWW